MRLTVAELLEARGLTPYALAKQSEGRISISAAYRLADMDGAFRCLRADVMDALCDVLKVEPGALFTRKPLPRRRP